MGKKKHQKNAASGVWTTRWFQFGVILAQSDVEAASTKAGNLAKAIAAETIDVNGDSFHLSVAFGAHALSGDQKVDEALDAADRAMYANKRANQEP